MADSVETMAATAVVETPRASGYLQQLCKHFAHKAPTSFDASEGRVAFAMGECLLRASPDGGVLTMTASAATNADLEHVQEIVGGHLERFAFREQLHVTWSAVRLQRNTG